MCGGRATDSTVKAYYVRFAETCKRWTSSLLMRTCHHSLFDPNNKPATLSQPLHDDHESDMHMIATSWLSVSPSTSLNDTCRTYVSRTVGAAPGEVPSLKGLLLRRLHIFDRDRYSSLQQHKLTFTQNFCIDYLLDYLLSVSMWSRTGGITYRSHFHYNQDLSLTTILKTRTSFASLSSSVRRLVAGRGEGMDE